MSPKAELVALKIRHLICDREMITASANLEIARADNWTCDWGKASREVAVEIDVLLKELESLI